MTTTGELALWVGEPPTADGFGNIVAIFAAGTWEIAYGIEPPIVT